jgi:hypothetical protein
VQTLSANTASLNRMTVMKSWHDISPSLTFPKGIRHGTVSTVSESIVEKIQNH